MEEKNEKNPPRKNERGKEQALRVKKIKNSGHLPERKKILQTVVFPSPGAEENNHRERGDRERTPPRRMWEEIIIEVNSYDNCNNFDDVGNCIDSFQNNNTPTLIPKNIYMDLAGFRIDY